MKPDNLSNLIFLGHFELNGSLGVFDYWDEVNNRRYCASHRVTVLSQRSSCCLTEVACYHRGSVSVVAFSSMCARL